MAEDAPTGVRRSGFRSWKRWLLGLGLLPLLAFGASNLALGSPWARDWIAGKIQHRCGLPVRIGGASWSPWRGVTLTELEISQPAALPVAAAEPLLRVDSVCLVPDWLTCIKRPFRVQSLTVERPRLVVTVEMMTWIARQQGQVTGPVVLQPPAQPPPVALNELPTGPPPEAVPGPAPAHPAAPPAAPPAVPAGPSQPTRWLHVNSASCQLVAANASAPLLRVDGLSGDFPFSGDAAKSSLRLGGIAMRGQPIIDGFAGQLRWEPPVLMLEPASTRCHGIELRLGGKVGMLPGLPLLVAIQVPEQACRTGYSLPAMSIAAKRAVLNARFQGFLVAPGTWQGDLIADAYGVTATRGAAAADFQIAHCGALLRGGVLSCVDARLLGEELSLLGNATLLADGRLGGVVRMVAAPERAAGLVQQYFPKLVGAPVFSSLSTPQRVAFDLSVFGTVNDPQLQFGQDGPVQHLVTGRAPMPLSNPMTKP